MTDNINNGKSDFIRLLLTTMENNSSDEKRSREYLSSQGMNVDAIVSDQLKRIKQLQLKLNMEKTQQEMKLMEALKSKAILLVNQLFSQANFSLPELIKQESIFMSFRNVETLDKEGIKEILIQHYMLKLREEEKNDPKF